METSNMPAWVTLVVALVVGLLGAAFARKDSIDPTAEAQRRPPLRKRLAAGIKRHKGKMLSATLGICLLVGCACSGDRYFIYDRHYGDLLQEDGSWGGNHPAEFSRPAAEALLKQAFRDGRWDGWYGSGGEILCIELERVK
jgi:hypothetical protein